MEAIGRVVSFLVTRAKAVVNYLKKVTQPKFVILFVTAYPYIYQNISYVLETVPQVIQNIADQFYSWIQATFWNIYNYIVNSINLGSFTGPIAGLIAGMAMAYPYLAYLFLKYALTPIASILATVALNVLGVVAYIFCKVVIPALKYAFGAYLFYRFTPATFRYIGKALDRFAQGKTLGAIGALAATLTPLAGFFLGYTVISLVTDPACNAIQSPLTIAVTTPVPYIPYTPYIISANPLYSTISGILTGYGYFPSIYSLPEYISYISGLISTVVQSFIQVSYIYNTVFPRYSEYYTITLVTYTPYGYQYYTTTPTIPLFEISYINNLVALQGLPISYSYISQVIEFPIFPLSLEEKSLVSTTNVSLNISSVETSYVVNAPSINISTIEMSYVSNAPSINISTIEMSYVLYAPSYAS